MELRLFFAPTHRYVSQDLTCENFFFSDIFVLRFPSLYTYHRNDPSNALATCFICLKAIDSARLAIDYTGVSNKTTLLPVKS